MRVIDCRKGGKGFEVFFLEVRWINGLVALTNCQSRESLAFNVYYCKCPVRFGRLTVWPKSCLNQRGRSHISCGQFIPLCCEGICLAAWYILVSDHN